MLGRHRLAKGLPCALLLMAAAQAEAQTRVTVTGQIRPRSEVRDPSGPDNRSELFTSMRTRLAARVLAANSVSAFVQFQDVRLFGEETNTLGDFSADGLDLHQGWVQIGEEEVGASLRVGRQEVVLGGERLVGAVGWAQQGRSFDGARARVHPSDRFRLDVFAAQLREGVSLGSESAFWSAHGTINPGGSQALDVYVLGLRAEAAAGDTDQWTLGGRHTGQGGAFRYRFEASYQTGTRSGRDVAAWMFGGRVGRAISDGSLTLWFDHLSGDKAGEEETGVFDTMFGTNHKFYGFADLFTNIPSHTAGRGLQDLAIKASWPVRDGWSLAADLHRFRVAEDAGLASSHLADELDLTLSGRLRSVVGLSGGVSWVLQGDALEAVRGIGEDVVFGYVMLDFGF